MELKVWVEGVQRVVCGITEQTTVQEVVIALAQATGRTGRYTLVEKWRDVEKMLPPTEQPLKVLSKWGDQASDIQFLLRRTGASSVSDSNNSRGPERNAYRQSLPPPAKNRNKNDILQGMKRKEPKRKSLTHTSNYENDKDKERVGLQNTNINNNNRIPLMPTKNKSMADNNRQNEQKDKIPQSNKVDNVKKPSDAFTTKINLANGNKDKGPMPQSSGPKKALLPPQMNGRHREPTTSVSSAKEALFPQSSIGEVQARSPTKAVLPSNAKYVRPRVTSSNSFDTAAANRNQNIPVSHQHSSSHDASNRQTIKEHEYLNAHSAANNFLPKQKKQWSATESLKGHARSGSAGTRTALLPPNIKRETNSASTLPMERPPFHPAMREGYSTQPLKDNSSKQSSAEIKALNEFNTLLSEQQKHINKQQETVEALENEIEMIQNDIKSREQINQSSLQSEIAQLEAIIEQNNTEMMNQALLMQQISVEEMTYESLKNDMAQSQENLKKTNLDLEKLEANILDLSMNVQMEMRKKEEMKQKNAMSAIKSEINLKSQNLNNIQEDVRRLESENHYLENDLAGKYAMMDTLNRELRQMDLQQFIRKTGSKITVLPPNTDEQLYGQSSSNISHPHAIAETNQSSGGEGVWV